VRKKKLKSVTSGKFIKIYPHIPVLFKVDGKMTVAVCEELRACVLHC